MNKNMQEKEKEKEKAKETPIDKTKLKSYRVPNPHLKKILKKYIFIILLE